MDLINNLYQDIKKEQFANKIALQYFGQKITYKKLWKEIDKVASVLTQFGIKKGDCISIALPNVVCAVTLLYGANKIGAVCNMMHPLLPVYKQNVVCVRRGGQRVCRSTFWRLQIGSLQH